MIAIRGKSTSLINKDQVEKGYLRNWMVVKFSQNNKTIAIINIYRIPVISQKGPYCYLTQNNKKNKNILF